MRYRFDLVCPVCNKERQWHVVVVPPDIGRPNNPRLKCGDCLFDRAEVIEFKVVKLTALDWKPIHEREST